MPDQQVTFAHRLVEEGVDLVHGHSSHHVKPIEVYHGRLILYGCGDFLDDYEGIGGYEQFRSDLRLMYLVLADPLDGQLIGARLVPLQVRQFRLHRVNSVDALWLRDLVNWLGARFGTHVQLEADNSLTLRWE